MNREFDAKFRILLKWTLSLFALAIWIPIFGIQWAGRAMAEGWNGRMIRTFFLFLAGLCLLESVPLVRFLWARMEYAYDLENLARWSLDRGGFELQEEAMRLGLRQGFKEVRSASIDLDRSSEGGVDLCRLRVRFEHRIPLIVLPCLPVQVDLAVRRAAESMPKRPDPAGEGVL